MPHKSSFLAANVLCRAALLLAISAPGLVKAATSVSQFGFIWSFSVDRPTGTFANGDPWVLGPVTITAISPADPGGGQHRHGSMMNPMLNSQQGYTQQIINGGQVYNEANNIARKLPLTVSSAASIVSSQTAPIWKAGGSIADKYAVLTVLMSEPPAGSFRPPYMGTDKTLPGNISQIDYAKLPSLANPGGGYPLSTVTAWYEALHYNHYTSWDNTHVAAKLQNFGYGREVAHWYSHGLLHLCLNHSNAEKKMLLIRLMQHGIDVWGFIKAGGTFYHDGGHMHGRKAPAVLAAYMLGDGAMMATVTQAGRFQEDMQTWIVTQADVGRDVLGPVEAEYTQAHVGLPEWGIRHYYEPNRDDSRWSQSATAYRFVCGGSGMGAVVWAQIMGLRRVWNWEPYFLYQERYWGSESGYLGLWSPTTTTNAIDTFVANMRNAYYSGVKPPPVTILTPVFTPGGGSYTDVQNVTITSATSGTSIRYTTNGSTPTASSGTVYGGPVALGVGTTTLKAIAYDATGLQSAVMSATYAISGINQVATPTASPSGGAYLVSQSVSLATSTLGATIRYTVNGGVPDATSPVYTGPFTVTANTTVRAIALKSGMTNSAVMDAVFTIGSITVGNQWVNGPLAPQSGVFSFAINAVPSAAGIDVLAGLSSNSAANFSDVAVGVRFSPSGVIDARNGGAYAAANVLTYVAGTNYRFSFIVDVPNHRYSATATPPSGTPVTIADNYAFRNEQAAAVSIANLAMFATSGSATFSNPLLGSSPSPPAGLRIE